MTTELKLQVPEQLYNLLELQALKQGVSIEALCLIYIDSQSSRTSDNFVDLSLYATFSLGQIREEIQRVSSSSLDREDKGKRLKTLSGLSLRFMKR
jgi:hypothetical protein